MRPSQQRHTVPTILLRLVFLVLTMTAHVAVVRAWNCPGNCSRRAWLQKSAATAVVLTGTAPATSWAAADCFQDCVQNCRQIAPKDPAYCNQNCRDYCDQPDRQGEFVVALV